MDCCKHFFFPSEVVDDVSYVSIEEENYHLLGHYQIYDIVVRRPFPSEEHRVVNLQTGKQQKMYTVELYEMLIEAGFTKEEIFERLPNIRKSVDFINHIKWQQASL